MKHALVTGGSGFFGGLLKRHLLELGWSVVNVDLEHDEDMHKNLESVQGDIRDTALMEYVCEGHTFDVVFHCAAQLAHAVKDKNLLWTSNVDGTRVVAECAKKFGIKHLIFTSSNCLWGENFGRPIREDDEPKPVELYGQSKLEGEHILQEYWDDLNVVIFRCPTITDAGRLGLMAILFEFIDEGRKVWVVGGGHNRYQFIYAGDLIDACIKAADYQGSEIFHIGSDDVCTFGEMYQYVIDHAKTGARVAVLPRLPTITAMKIAYALKLSPLGPYQYKMIAEDFEFDTKKIKDKLEWKPTLTNKEMLLRAYDYYRKNKKEIYGRTDVSAHKQPAKMGIIKLLKWMS